ncbi:MAG: hypothetical protein IJI14_04710 [Anaerolineaceae bacterium]|nr:hypothetical protein [Anaerolineaceae bacterium]
MSNYPSSSPVAAGQATEADQYNFLRNDALYLGAEPGTSGNLRELLYQSAGTLRLSRSSKTSITLEASEAPCALMIGGKIFSAGGDLSISLSADAFPSSGRLYLYAVGLPDGSFRLTAGGAAVPAGGRRIGTFLWSGGGVIPGTVRTAAEWEMTGKFTDISAAQGRLTLVPGEPVPDTDISMAEYLYYTPYNGNTVALYIDGTWESFSFSELSMRLSGMQRKIPYDVFIHADEYGLHLSALSWGTAEARPSGMLTRVDGIRVSGGDSGKRYLGTIVLNEAGYGEDSRNGRLLWNESHRMPRPLFSRLSTTKTQGTSRMNAWVPYYDEDAPAVRLLIPAPDAEFCLEGVGLSSPISESDRGYLRTALVGICRDMMMESPYTGNVSCVAAFTHSFGNGPLTVQIRNRESSFQGYHRYTLAFWTNYSFYPTGTAFSDQTGGWPGLYGVVYG